ncbi:RraA family protein [Falsiroseomonas sp. HW251]|uniref:RraA family protein n=1 Tax=Falsiroseomonas sp. HW251 TaxID=3390998 RepID=UPI003D30FA28
MADHAPAPHEVDTQALQKEARLMRLEALIAEREHHEIVPLPRPDEEILARYERLYTGAISDVLREHVLMDQAIPGHLHCLRPERTVAGFAFTVKSAPNTKVTGELTFRTGMIEKMGRNDFVVWDTSGDIESTAWGGVMTATAVGLGVRGAMIDGGIRDTAQILQKDFPVFYRYRSPNGSLGRCLISHYQVPIRIGTVWIRPGDIVVGDMDGVMVVPRGLAMAVLERAEQILGNEREIFRWVAEGDSVRQITEKGGYF